MDSNFEALRIELGALRACIDRLSEAFGRRNLPKLWTATDVSLFFQVNEKTAREKIVTLPGFPEPVGPTMAPGGERRWFDDEVVEFARDHRVGLPRPRRKRQSSKAATSEGSAS
jgi:hypothetical protein